MKLIPAFLLVAATVISSASADIVIVQTVDTKGVGMDMQMEMKMQLKDGKMRMDVGDQMSTLIGGDSGDVTTLVHSQKMVMVMKAEQIKAAAANFTKQDGEQASVDLKATGNKETINGYETEEYIQEQAGNTIHLWIAKDYPGYKAVLDQMNAAGKAMAGMSPGADMSKFDSSKIPGMPIRTIVKMPGGGTATTLLKSVEETTLDNSIFEVPADYKSMAMPSFGAPPTP